MQKKILITGSSSGFGLLFTKSLALKGHTVYASMRNLHSSNKKVAEELRDWAEKNKCRIEILELDVTDELSVQEAVKLMMRNENRIDALINNAGISSLGVMESYSLQDFRRIFDVNVLGTFLVTSKVIPIMRKQNSGLFINQSSSLGRFTIPLTSAYIASKWSIEALSECWNYEFKEFNIDTVILEAGVFPNTDMRTKLKEYAPSNPDAMYEYEDMLRVMVTFMKAMKGWQDEEIIVSPQVVADKVCEIVDMKQGTRPLRVVIDPIHEKPLQEFSKHYKKLQEDVLSGIDLEKYSKLI